MKRIAEAVLNGHPDKFCDLVADAVLRHAYRCDPEAYGQVEVSVWSDQIFLTGAVVTREKFDADIRQIIVDTGLAIGYTPENHIDVYRYQVADHICKIQGDPGTWTRYVNDQNIVWGYAGYDELTVFLPPEHFGAWYFREQLIRALQAGPLKGHGPDGKVLLVMREEGSAWHIETLLLTLQQREKYSFTRFTEECCGVLADIYSGMQKRDGRWQGRFGDTRVLVNPNGPLLNGGSDGDNGQTGRKLVMDYYGPRIPIGGGAIYGKDLTHIDRLAAFQARRLAVDLVAKGSQEALVRVCYAPGMDEPLEVSVNSSNRPAHDLSEFFSFGFMRQSVMVDDLNYELSALGTFFNAKLSFNSPSIPSGYHIMSI